MTEDQKPGRGKSTDEALVASTRLTDMMGRVPFNINDAVQPANAEGVASAVEVCSVCGYAGRCDEWIARHPEGEGHAIPEFCGNQTYLKSYPPKGD